MPTYTYRTHLSGINRYRIEGRFFALPSPTCITHLRPSQVSKISSRSWLNILVRLAFNYKLAGRSGGLTF